jgi:hypothetical protein
MTDAVTLHNLYNLNHTIAWLAQRTGSRDTARTSQLQDFVRCDVFDDYRPALHTAARMKLWCAAHGYQLSDGPVIEHDDEPMTRPVTVVLATTTGSPHQAVALVAVDGGDPEVFADVTTDTGYWLDNTTIKITCPSGCTWTWDGGRDLHAPDGTSMPVHDAYGPHDSVISRCRGCTAYDDGLTDIPCPCPGHAVYCHNCGQRCTVDLPDVPTFDTAN